MLVDSLPSLGDHHTNGPAIGLDGRIDFGQGTATNSAVVGIDNLRFGWLTDHPDFHDIPCRDLVLTGRNYVTPNPSTQEEGDSAVTGALDRNRFRVPDAPVPDRVLAVHPSEPPAPKAFFGVLIAEGKGSRPYPGTGVIW